MKKIALSKTGKVNKGKYFALVSDKDYDWLNQWKWHAIPAKNTVYAGRHITKNGKPTTQEMQRLIMGVTDPKIQVDHENRNGLDNQRGNLRECTKSQNQQNRESNKGSSSKFKGVYWSNERKIWRAQIKVPNRTTYVCQFKSEVDCAIMYNFVAYKAFGKFARLNEIPKE